MNVVDLKLITADANKFRTYHTSRQRRKKKREGKFFNKRAIQIQTLIIGEPSDLIMGTVIGRFNLMRIS